MLHKIFKFKALAGALCVVPLCSAMADENALIAAMQNTYTACIGINGKLDSLKKMAGINTAITGVGTGLGIGATAVGIAKSVTDKDLDEELKKLANNESVYGAPVMGIDAATYKADFGPSNVTPTKSRVDELTQKSKKLGNWRTGLLAANTATNIAGAVIAAKNRTDDDLQSHIERCASTLSQLSRAKVQAELDGVDTSEATGILNACNGFASVDLSKIDTRATGAMTASTVGAVTGLTGTITSAAANSDSVRQLDESGARTDKEKNLNTASNVLAGASTVASATATIFNASQIKAIKDVASIADRCTEVLQ